MHTMNPVRTDLTISCAARLRSEMSITELQERLRSVANANPLLSKVITNSNGTPLWTAVDLEEAVQSAVQPTLRASGIEQAHAWYAQFVDRPWELTQAVPWMVQLVTTDEANFLFCKFHHIICDGDRSLRLFFDGLTNERQSESAAFAEILTEPQRAETWDATIRELTDSISRVGNIRERIAESSLEQSPGVRWNGALNLGGPTPDECDEVMLLSRLRTAIAPLVHDEQTLVAVPFDGCTSHQQEQIGYFGNPGLVVLSATDATADWPTQEYARAKKLSAIPFQTVMADRRFRESVDEEKPFDTLLVPRSLFTYESRLIESVYEPIPSSTPYALVLNYWRGSDRKLRISLESGVFGPEVLHYLGTRVCADIEENAGEADQPAPMKATQTPGHAHTADSTDPDIMKRFEDAVNRHHDDPAIDTQGGQRVSYGELWKHAVSLAQFLNGNLRTADRTIAIVGAKHPNEIVCMLGAHLIGGSVLRLDRDPAATRRAIASVQGIAAIISLNETEPTVLENLPVAAEPEYILNGPFGAYRISLVAAGSHDSAVYSAKPGDSDTLYITLTSGSTGQPKPIPFSRVEFNRLISWHLRTFPGPRRMLQFSRLSFDVAYHVIYATLCSGGTLMFGSAKVREDPKELLDYINAAQIQKLYLPTVLLRPLAEFATATDDPNPTPSLSEVIVAGGCLAITDEIREWFARTSARLFNHYGMSETQDITSHLLTGDPWGWPERPPVGLPIDGADIRIVGSTGQELPASLSGAVVARSITGDTDTGDIGYRDRDGLLHILGRADRVVKQRGFRVNLQALEAQVTRAPGISEAVAVSYAPPQASDAIAVVAIDQDSAQSTDPGKIKAEVTDTLGPGYKFDLYLVPQIPRLPNAKPDLREIARTAERLAAESVPEGAGGNTAEPTGSVVLSTVRQLMPAVDVDEQSRFLDVGLDSISLMTLAARLKPAYPEISIADFFRYPTVGALQQRLDSSDGIRDESVVQPADRARTTNVAVIGLAGRFPGSPDVETFWQGLLAGKSAITHDAPQEADGSPAATFVPAQGKLSDVDMFDYSFFGMSPAEARRMDPQVRVFLQLCWSALENAGEANDVTGKNVGIFAGCGLSTYLMNTVEPHRQRASESPFLEHNTLPERLGNDRNYLTSTVSYRLGLTGPSIVVQAACATSLTAVHMARQALLNGECDIALAGGVSIIYPQPDGYEHVDGSVRSRQGECLPFDRHADGTVFGNGAGVVVLRRAEEAAAHRNTVYAEIVGSATNHDGSVKGSFSAPNPASQTQVIDAALRASGTPDIHLDFVEAHGTGTSVGDAIEWNALLASTIANANGAARTCLVGSVKSNVGHLDEAAGIAGFIKACLSVHNHVFPGTYGFHSLHPHLTESSRFEVSAQNVELPGNRPSYGGVSSFGMGGANCHVIIRSPDTSVTDSADRPGEDEGAKALAERLESVYVPVTGKTRDAVSAMSERLTTHLDRYAERISVADLIRTMGYGRSHFTEYRGILHRTADGAHLVAHDESTDGHPAANRRAEVVWAFPGQGSGFSWTAVADLSRWPIFAGKFQELLAEFAERIDGAVFRDHVGRPTGDPAHPLIAPSHGACGEHCTMREQVLQFSFQLALARLLESFGIKPDVVVGHSLGEIAATVCAGLISETDALALVAERSRLMDLATADGFMTQLRCTLDQATDIARELDLDIAAINGPRQIVVAGDGSRAEDLRRRADDNGIKTVRLTVDKAFHSRLMTDAAAELGRCDLTFTATPSSIDFVRTNLRYPGEEGSVDLGYWTSQLTSPVDYVSACRTVLSRSGRKFFIELGATSTLTNLMRATVAEHSAPQPALTGGVRKSASDYIAKVTAAAFQAGRELDWYEINQVPPGGLISLPSYPFSRTVISPYGAEVPTRHQENTRSVPSRTPAPMPPAACGMTVSCSDSPDQVRHLRFELSPGDEDWIREHKVAGQYVVPAAGIIVLFARVGQVLGLTGVDTALADISFERPIAFASETEAVEAHVSVWPESPHEVTLWTRPKGSAVDWTRNAAALFAGNFPDSPAGQASPEDIDASARRIPAERLYEQFEEHHLVYGAGYRGLDDVVVGPLAATARWAPSRSSAGRTRIGIEIDQVAGIDGVIQVADTLDNPVGPDIRMPAYIAQAGLKQVENPGPAQRIHITKAPENGSVKTAEGKSYGVLRDERLGVVADLADIRFQAQPRTEPIAHRLRWREHIAVAAGLPATVSGAIEEVFQEEHAARAGEVAEYQRQLRLLENRALQIFETAGGREYVRARMTAGPDGLDGRPAKRRVRAFGAFSEPSAALPAQSAEPLGDKVATESSILQNCADSLAQYFDGSLDGETILFGGDGPDHLRAYYQSSFLLNRLNEALRRIVAAAATANSPRTLKVLEVGGGTGATTEGLLAGLQECGALVDYTFTDISAGLIRRADDRFGDHPGFRTATVDLDSDESVAALDQDYDIVVAVDVIHATRDIDRTIDRLSGRLAPNGMVLLVEDLKSLAWVDLTFGLLDGWWSFDDELRTDHPLLELDQWQSLLSSYFGHVEVHRACGELPLDEAIADEGLFVCANPRPGREPGGQPSDRPSDARGGASAAQEPLLIDMVCGEDIDDLLTRIDGQLTSQADPGARPRTLVLSLDTGTSAVLDPGQAEWFADALLRALRLAEGHSTVENVVLRTLDAIKAADGSLRVLTAGSMAAALARVAASEGRRADTFSLAVDSSPDAAAAIRQVTTLLTHCHPYVNGVVADGSLFLPHVAAEPEPETAPQPVLPYDSAVLFGGESEIGLAAARWLSTTGGIDRIYLAGRSAAREPTRKAIARLNGDGADVRYLTADVSSAGEVGAVARTVMDDASRPLVLNLAAVLRDGLMDSVTADDLSTVLGPKVSGSHNIHSAFRDTAAHVILFSSTSALLGNAGQAAHSMACAYMDGLADSRLSTGPATTSVQWGPWDDVGITARLGLNDQLRRAGENPSPATVFLAELGRAAQGSGGTAIAADLSSPAVRRSPFLSAMLPAPPLTTAAPRSGHAPRSAGGDDDRGAAGNVAASAPDGDIVRWAVASVLGVAPDAVSADLTLADNGVDSLNLIEVRSLIEQAAGIRVPLNSLSDAPSVAAIRPLVAPASAGAGETTQRINHSAAGAGNDGETIFYVAGIFGRVDGAPDFENAAMGGPATLTTLSSPTRAAGAPGRLDISEVTKDLADHIEREQATGSLTLAGHSFGAMLAYSAGVELRRRGRELRQLVLIDGEPVAAASAASANAPSPRAASEAEFDALLTMSTDGRGSQNGSLTAESRSVAFDSYQANCEIARSPQVIEKLECPVIIAIPEENIGVGVTPSRAEELRETVREKLGGTSIEIVRIPGDHFTMLRSPNVEHLVKHIVSASQRMRGTQE